MILQLPPDPETGQKTYCVHWGRELRFNFKTQWVLLTGSDVFGNPVEGMQPSSYWKQIVKLTTTPSRPLGIKGSFRMLSKKLCPCFVHASISQCSCPHCTTFLENMDHRHLGRWHYSPTHGDQDVDPPCDKCAGECNDPMGPWRAMSGGVVEFMKHILCDPVPVPGLFVSAVDPLSGLEIPEKVVPLTMIPRRCWMGECSKCGWNVRFAKFPLLPVTINEDDETQQQVFVRACPREACIDKTTTMHQFLKMERGTSQDGKPYVQPEWTPVVVSRREFFYRLYTFMEEFMPHYYTVQWHKICDRLFLQQYRRLAFDQIPDQPQPHPSMKGTRHHARTNHAHTHHTRTHHARTNHSRTHHARTNHARTHHARTHHVHTNHARTHHARTKPCTHTSHTHTPRHVARGTHITYTPANVTHARHARTGTAILTKDFAACVDHDKKFNKTCAHPERSHEWVGVYQCSPYMHRYTDVQRKKRLKCNRDVQSEVRQKVFAIFAFSKRKGDTVFDQSVQSDLVHVMRTGKLPPGSKAEWFWRGKRLVGSCTTRPLTSKLQEASQPLPLHPELIRLVDKRDRCVNAYACVRAHVCACTWLSQPLKPLH